MKDRLIVGLMSGTSVDGIDAALVRVTAKGRGRYGAKVVFHLERDWPGELRRRLLGVMAPAVTSTQEICELNVLVAREFAGAVEELLKAAGVSRERVAAIGSHGQTVCHLPPKTQNAKLKTQNLGGSTLQIGDVSVIATLTGITTVGNFRPADMALGGQGAPLVPWADAMLLRDGKRGRCVQNIGGIANVTYLPVRGEVVAFDTGPGNMLIDAVVAMGTRGRKRFDEGGKIAARGELEGNLFGVLKGHPYFAERPPKSTGRELFGEGVAKMLVEEQRKRGGRFENLVHTVTRLTAWSIVEAYERFLPRMPEEVILCGGGADNAVLVGMIGEEFKLKLKMRGEGVKILRIDEFGIPNKAKEAASFALLAAATLDGVAGNLPSVTGAKHGTVLGVVAPGMRGRRS